MRLRLASQVPIPFASYASCTGLPAIAVYRGGRLLDSLLRLQDICGVLRPSSDDLASILIRARVLDGLSEPVDAASGVSGKG